MAYLFELGCDFLLDDISEIQFVSNARVRSGCGLIPFGKG